MIKKFVIFRGFCPFKEELINAINERFNEDLKCESVIAEVNLPIYGTSNKEFAHALTTAKEVIDKDIRKPLFEGKIVLLDVGDEDDNWGVQDRLFEHCEPCMEFCFGSEDEFRTTKLKRKFFIKFNGYSKELLIKMICEKIYILFKYGTANNMDQLYYLLHLDDTQKAEMLRILWVSNLKNDIRSYMRLNGDDKHCEADFWAYADQYSKHYYFEDASEYQSGFRNFCKSLMED